MDCCHASPKRDLMELAKAVSPTPDQQTSATDSTHETICAYFKLIFPNYTYYIQTPSVTIGRRSVRPDTPSTSDIPQVDVDLGPLKSVSRFHAKIEYEDSEERFVLVVLGRNGAWVDRIWSGSGSRVPLSSRSQIQIATRVFDFVLPPPPAPEDSPSPSSPSTTRHHSPSIDITSVSPDSSVHSPIAKDNDLPPIEVTEKPLPVSLGKGKPPPKSSSKKRKKPGDARPPPPAVMPPRPQFTYAQLCYKAICSMEGKATLQDICSWVSDNFDWYRYNEGSGWESSIRHNLSSNRAFKKMERCAGERGKGFFWSVDEQFEHLVKDQEGKVQGEGARNKAKNPKLLEPPLKRSVKGNSSSPLPPPLTSTLPLSINQNITAVADNIVYPTTTLGPSNLQQQGPPTASTSAVTSMPVKFEHVSVNFQGQTQHPPVKTTLKTEPVEQIAHQTQPTSSTTPAVPPSTSAVSSLPPISSDIVIPIVIGSVPPADQSSALTSNNATSVLDLSSPPIALHKDTIVLNPTIFSSLTIAQLKELELLGAKKAIEILQTYIVRFLKEKRKAEAKGKKKKSKKKEGQGGSKIAIDSTTANSEESTLLPTLRGSEDENTVTGNQQAGKPDETVNSELNAEAGSSGNDLTVSISASTQAAYTVAPSSPVMSPTAGIVDAVTPLRINSPTQSRFPQPMAPLEGEVQQSVMEEIDIMGDSDDMEHVSKRRKLDVGPEQIQV